MIGHALSAALLGYEETTILAHWRHSVGIVVDSMRCLNTEKCAWLCAVGALAVYEIHECSCGPPCTTR